MAELSKKANKRPIVNGVIGGLALILIYFAVLTFANSFDHALEQFRQMWYWIVLLVFGFGTQVGLYSYIKLMQTRRTAVAATEMAASGGLSTGAMIACCAHHLTDILPILGLSAAVLFLVKFQTLFIVIGVLSNLIGINLMLKIIQEDRFYAKKGLLQYIFQIDMKKMMNYRVLFSVIMILIDLARSLG